VAALTRFVRWTLFGAYLALTILLSSMTRPPVAEAVSYTMLHAIEFAVMAMLLLQALGQGLFKRHTARHLGLTAAFGVVYGASDEIHQYFTPGRHSSVKDAVVDGIATISTVALFALLSSWLGRRPGAAGAGGSAWTTSKPEAAGAVNPGSAGPHRVEFLTREGCHLCAEALRVLESALGPAGQGFEVVDVDSAPELAARYGSEVPVVLVDGVKRFKGRVEPARLAKILSERSRLRTAEERSGGSEGGRATEGEAGGVSGSSARDRRPGRPPAPRRPYPET